VGNPYLLTLLEGRYLRYDKAQKGQLLSRRGPKKGQPIKGNDNILSYSRG
jgi:hypothetical protein